MAETPCSTQEAGIKRLTCGCREFKTSISLKRVCCTIWYFKRSKNKKPAGRNSGGRLGFYAAPTGDIRHGARSPFHIRDDRAGSHHEVRNDETGCAKRR